MTTRRRRETKTRHACRLAGLLAAAALCGTMMSSPAVADAVSDFYRGKAINIHVGFPPGGGYDIYARLVADHFGRHIPGNPSVVVQNMPGGGGIRAAGYVANATPQDGRALGVFLDSLLLTTMLQPDAKFAMDKFVWIGRVTSTTTYVVGWHTAPAKSVEQAKQTEFIIAATARTSTSALIPYALNQLIGTKFKVVLGYDGSGPMALAMERGEVHGLGGMSWEAIKTGRPQWLSDRSAVFLFRVGTERHPELPNVRAVTEFATSPGDKALLTLLGSGPDIGRSLAAEPRIPAERAEALRRAFMTMVRDPAFRADAEKRKLEVDPLDGARLQRLIDEAVSTPPELVERLKGVAKG